MSFLLSHQQGVSALLQIFRSQETGVCENPQRSAVTETLQAAHLAPTTTSRLKPQRSRERFSTF